MSGSTVVKLAEPQGRFAIELDDMLRRHFRDADQARRYHARSKSRLEEALPSYLPRATKAFERAAPEVTELRSYVPAEWPEGWEQVEDDPPNPLNPPRAQAPGPVTLRFFLAQVNGGVLSLLATFDPVPTKRSLASFSKALIAR